MKHLALSPLGIFVATSVNATVLTLEDDHIWPSEGVVVNYSAVADENIGTEWVGIYKEGTEPTDGNHGWHYLTTKEGQVKFDNISPGKWYIDCMIDYDYETKYCERLELEVHEEPTITVHVDGLPKRIAGISNNYSPDLAPAAASDVMSTITITYTGLGEGDTIESVTDGTMSLEISQDGYRFSGLASDQYQIRYELNTQLYVDRLPEKADNELRVVAANVWRTDLYGWDDDSWQGLHMGRGGQVIRTFVELDADVIGMQEYMHTEVVGLDPEWIETELEKATGEEWSSCKNERIVTRLEVSIEHAQGCEIILPNGKPFYFGEVHLGLHEDWSNHYVPYTAHKGWTEEEIVTAAEANWGTGNDNIIADSNAVGNAIPAFFVGDYNEPSHNDYTEKAADHEAHKPLAEQRIPLSIPSMPMSNIMLRELGYVDTYDEARQRRNAGLNNGLTAEINYPGVTWGNYGVADAHRIDFIYYRNSESNPMQIKESYVIGGQPDDNPAYPFENDHVEVPYTANIWPSDHRWVLTSMTYDDPPEESEEPDEESGGSTGIVALFSLLSLGLFRRKSQF
ncbi:hypothetical protein L4D09_09350 [Photobacterium makurazakiensis]|uniref:hypothetical protein n=1 Tax=Photobacterium makurazakiensis TaxID=2910234 RepID=UPI003D111EBB